MRNFLLIISSYVLCSAFAVSEPFNRPAAWKDINHIVVLILENTKYDDAIDEPFLRDFAKAGALLKNSHGVIHPSQPNYIALIAGATHGVIADRKYSLDKLHLGDLLEDGSKTWKTYAEGYPGNGFLGEEHGRYRRKHVPFLSFKSVQDSPRRLSYVVDLWEFFSDHRNNTLPNFSMIIPDMDNDGHDTGVGRASNSSKTFLSSLMNDAEMMKKTLIIITFDEDNSTTWTNDIYTAFYGAGVKAGAISKTTYNHYNVLRTIEEIFNIGNLGEKDKDANPILDIWKDS